MPSTSPDSRTGVMFSCSNIDPALTLALNISHRDGSTQSRTLRTRLALPYRSSSRLRLHLTEKALAGPERPTGVRNSNLSARIPVAFSQSRVSDVGVLAAAVCTLIP